MPTLFIFSLFRGLTNCFKVVRLFHFFSTRVFRVVVWVMARSYERCLIWDGTRVSFSLRAAIMFAFSNRRMVCSEMNVCCISKSHKCWASLLTCRCACTWHRKCATVRMSMHACIRANTHSAFADAGALRRTHCLH